MMTTKNSGKAWVFGSSEWGFAVTRIESDYKRRRFGFHLILSAIYPVFV